MGWGYLGVAKPSQPLFSRAISAFVLSVDIVRSHSAAGAGIEGRHESKTLKQGLAVPAWG